MSSNEPTEEKEIRQLRVLALKRARASESLQEIEKALEILKASFDLESTIRDDEDRQALFRDRELQKADLEISKLKNDLDESRRPYIWRNLQVVPTAITALGAVVGLGIALYSNYFGTLKDKADLAQQVAGITMKQAQLTQADAKIKAAAAEELRRKAEKMISDDENNIKEAHERAESASNEAKLLEQQNREFKDYIFYTNKPLFESTGLPKYLYRQQDQFRHLGLLNLFFIRSNNYGWVTDPQLQSIAFGASASGGKIQLTDLHTVRPSIEEVQVSAYNARSIDLETLAGVGTLKRFSLFIGGPDANRDEIRNLHLARDLESLSLAVFYGNQLFGIEDILRLPNLRDFRLQYARASSVPSSVLGRVTSLSLTGARPLDPTPVSPAEFRKLASSTRLTTLSLPGQIATSDWANLSNCRSLRQLLILNADLTMDSQVTFPQITGLLVSLEKRADAQKVFHAFPNLRDFAFQMGTYFDEKNDAEPLLKDIATHYPSLHSLTVYNGINSGGAMKYTFPRFPALQTLRLQLSSVNSAAPAQADLNPEQFPSLTRLVVNAPAVTPGQLHKLPHLRSVILNDLTPEILTELQSLRHLETLEFSQYSLFRSTAVAPPKIPEGSAQAAADHLAPIRLVLAGAELISEFDHVPPTVQFLDLDGTDTIPLGMYWLSDQFFFDAYD